MSRRPATIERDIPLFLVPHTVVRGVLTHGKERERVIVRRASFHFSNVRFRSRLIKRELKGLRKDTSGTPGAAAWEEKEDRADKEEREDRDNGGEGGERV